MSVKALLCLALFSATRAMAASPGFLLGVDYSEWLGLSPLQVATDRSGNLYILSQYSTYSYSAVTKVSADGKTILWQNQLGFPVSPPMAVDPNGGVYVLGQNFDGDGAYVIAKLSASGSGVAWQTPGFSLNGVNAPVLAADSQGRAYLAAGTSSQTTIEVMRLNAAGSAFDYTALLAGYSATSIAVDQSGVAYVAGFTLGLGESSFLAQLKPDGSAGFYKTTPPGTARQVALDADGNVALFGGGVLQRVDSTGAITLSTAVTGFNFYGAQLTLDAAGNAYIGEAVQQLFPVKNSMATCESGVSEGTSESIGVLAVVAPDGTLLQTTYISSSQFTSQGGLVFATGPNSTVYVVAAAGPSFAPTQAGPFPAGSSGTIFLMRVSSDASVQTYPLACVVNGATFGAEAVAPGEIVTLFGNGLGPQQGVQGQATLQSPFTTQTANVEVTFDGTPAPLLWVQDSQINAVVPWSLTPGQNTQVCVSVNNAKTNCLTWPVAQAAPAVFTVDGFHAAAVNQDGTLNSASNPAPVGSIVSVWATGLGPITPAQADGSLVGLPLPTNVLTGGVEWIYTNYPFDQQPVTQPLVILYEGPAPYLVAGASQIDFQAVFAGSGALYVNLPSAMSQGFQIYVAGQ